ncbi:MAG: sulfatase-like hydrolase/transferase [Firmicutes bacterium]|nr:sulfatase-like hydrolase/transferase [Bacillota bacterium]
MRDKLKGIFTKVFNIVKKQFLKVGAWFQKKFPRKTPKYFDGDLHEAKYILLMAVYAFFIYLFIEEFARITIGPFEGILFLVHHPVVFFYNVAIIFSTMTLALLFKRRRFAWVIISLVWIALGIVNGGILLKRMTPFTLYDMQNLGDGMTLVTTYFSKWQIVLGLIAIGVLAAQLILIFIRSEKWTNVKYKKSLTAIALSVALTLGATFGLIKIGVLSTFFGNLNYAYNDYGVPYCFISTSLNKGISKPDSYSEELMTNILEEYTKKGTDTLLDEKDDDMEHPNVIVLQMESFTTAQDYTHVSVDKDPTPVFNSLQEKYTSGMFTVPACGAGTANTEFEVLTGVSARFFGPGEYPYKGKLRNQSLQSMGYILKNHGYETSALHNHRALFYNRNEVYANLGFNTYTSVEYMNNIKKTPTNWCKDTVMIDDIMDIMNQSKGRDFMHIISVEGHGSYPTEQVFKDPYTTVSCDDEATKWKYEYYLNECHEMDTFIGDLIGEIEATGEPTILLIYGDHIPALDVKESEYACGDLYKTRYVIWDNIGLEKKDADIASYEAGAILLADAGFAHEGVIFDYQQTANEKAAYFEKYHKALSYDMIYGKNYVFGGVNPYSTVHLTMGHRRIKVIDIVKIGDNYYLRGENFTEHSSVSIKGKLLKTVYLSPTLLAITEELDPDDISKLQVSQIDTKDDTILSTINALEEL